MIRAQLRSLSSLLLLVGSFIAYTDTQAQSNTLSVTLSFVNLPTTITLCRKRTAWAR